MLDSLWVAVPVSIVLGFLTGLGTGGGSLLILWLTMALHMEQNMARTINLMFFLPAAVIAYLFRGKQGSFHFRKVLPAIIAGCVAAFLFSRLGAFLDLDMLKKLFGVLLLFMGVRELRYKQEEGR